MKFEREHYIEKLISSKHNHLIKIVTGLRRVGKSYLLLNLYKQHLLDSGVDTSHIIEVMLDSFVVKRSRLLQQKRPYCYSSDAAKLMFFGSHMLRDFSSCWTKGNG